MAVVHDQPPSAAPTLVGRETEQLALARAIETVAAGRGQVVLLSGEPGIGKSSLARWTAERARDAGLPVHWGFAWEGGGAPPYWPWTQCLRALLAPSAAESPGLHPALRQLLPELLIEAEPPARGLEPEQARFQLLEGVRALLSAQAVSQPFLLVLEDLHAADRESLYLLQYVCQHAAACGFMLLGTFRELQARLGDESSPLWRCAREATLLTLSGLRAADIGELLERIDGRAPTPERIRQMQAATEGNPLYLNELLAVAGSADARGELSLAASGNLQQLILQHLQTLPRDCFDILSAASVLGREFGSEALAALLDKQAEELEAGLRPAVQATLLRATEAGNWRFAHLFHREALYAALEPERRRELHLRRATNLEEALRAGFGESWAELAGHYLAAGPSYRRQAVEAWRAAARRAADRLAFTEAATLYARALEAFGAGPGADPGARCQLQVQAACATLRAGELEKGHALCLDAFRLARTLEDPVLMATSALAYGTAFAIGKVDPELVRLLRESLDALERSPEDRLGHQASGLRPRLLARLAAALQPAPMPGEPVAMAFEAVEQARLTRDRRCLYETLTSAISALMDFADAGDRLPLTREYATLAEEFDDVAAQFRAQSLLIIDGLELGDPELMEAATDLCGRLADRIGLPHYRWRVDSARALLSTVRGEPGAASRHHAQAVKEAHRVNDPVAQTTLALQAFGLLAERDRIEPEELRRAHETVAEAFAASGVDDLYARPMMARAYLRLGDEQTAQSICSSACVSRLLGMPEMSNVQIIGDCAVLRSDADLARRVYRLLQDSALVCGHSGLYGMSWNGPVSLTLARLARLLGEDAAVTGHLERALSVAQRMGAQHLEKVIRSELGAVDATDSRPRQKAGAAIARIDLAEAGEVWRLRFEGREATLKDSKGLRILARLLAEPDREFHALDLNSSAGSALIEASTDAAAVSGIDRQAAEAYRERLAGIAEALQEAREHNDPGRVDSLLEEQEALQGELGRAFGLGGRRRPAGAAAERARVNVTRRLRDAIARIGEQLPEAGRYLDNTVKTGTYCKFTAL